MPSSDLFASPAVQILCRVEAEGLTFDVTPEGRLRVGPVERLSPDLTELIRQHRDDLVVLARVCHPTVQARVEVFRRLIDDAPVGVVLPALLYRRGVAYTKGHCFSCGDRLEQVRWGRCWRCALAVRVAMGMPLTALGHAREGASVS